jgi:hypothetical protein
MKGSSVRLDAAFGRRFPRALIPASEICTEIDQLDRPECRGDLTARSSRIGRFRRKKRIA